MDPSWTWCDGAHHLPSTCCSGTVTNLSNAVSQNVLWHPPSASHLHFPWLVQLTKWYIIVPVLCASIVSRYNIVPHLYWLAHLSVMNMIMKNYCCLHLLSPSNHSAYQLYFGMLSSLFEVFCLIDENMRQRAVTCLCPEMKQYEFSSRHRHPSQNSRIEFHALVLIDTSPSNPSLQLELRRSVENNRNTFLHQILTPAA